MTENKNKRIEWIDIAKAFAIILVGVGHYNCPKLLQTWIYIFHMPLFFMLSGITLNVENISFKKFLCKKTITFLVPWAIAVCVNVVFQTACRMMGVSANSDKIMSIPLRLIVNLRPGECDPIYWFLPCLFVTEIFLFWVLKIAKGKYSIAVEMGFLTFVAMVYQYFFDMRLPWEMDLLPISSVFVLCGFVLKTNFLKKLLEWNYKQKIIRMTILIITGSFLGFANSMVISKPIDIASGRYGIVLLMLSAAVCISLGIMILCTFVHSRLISFIGENSLLFYLAQPIAYKVVDIGLILLFGIIPFYTYSFGGNWFDMILLHVGTNISIILFVIVYKKFKVFSKRILNKKGKDNIG